MVIFLNDLSKYNKLYRKNLMTLVKRRIGNIYSLGIFDSPLSVLKLISFNFKECIIVSSNLKSNCLALITFAGPLVVIVNGLGRFRGKAIFRSAFRFLIDLRSRRARAVFQNYADFRYYRRFCKRARIYWVPGSGGVSRDTGDSIFNYIVVQRDSKLALVADSLKEAVRTLGSLRENAPVSYTLVGCSQACYLAKPQLSAFTNVGHYPQEQIFIDGKSFIQPEGYGEGVPHTLVDAICSGMQVIIKKRCFLRYGFHKLDCGFRSIGDGWLRLEATDSTKLALAVDTVNESYFQIIKSTSGR